MQPVVMPRNLNDPMMVLLWSADEFVPGFFIFALGIMLNQKLICLILALLLMHGYRKLKDGRQDGFALHILYWSGIVDTKTRTMPNPFYREYLP